MLLDSLLLGVIYFFLIYIHILLKKRYNFLLKSYKSYY